MMLSASTQLWLSIITKRLDSSALIVDLIPDDIPASLRSPPDILNLFRF